MRILRKVAISIAVFLAVKALFYMSHHMAANPNLDVRRDASSEAAMIDQSNGAAYLAPVQNVGSFSVQYAYPFLNNERETQNLASAVNVHYPGKFDEIVVYTSKPSCGVNEARLVVASYAQGMIMEIDSVAEGAINQVSTLDGIVDPESTIAAETISGLPARTISYRAKRWGGTIGFESIVILDKSSKNLWQLQLIFGAQNTSDFFALSGAMSCARKILKSVVVEPL